MPEQLERDWCSASTGGTHSAPFFGAKPAGFSRWLFRLLGLGDHPADELVDVFPGSGAVSREWDAFRARATTSRSGLEVQNSLFGDP